MRRRTAAAAERPAWRERLKRLDAAYTEAAHDSAFLADMIEIDRAFDSLIFGVFQSGRWDSNRRRPAWEAERRQRVESSTR